MKSIVYPTVERIIQANIFVLTREDIERFQKVVKGHEKLLDAIGRL